LVDSFYEAGGYSQSSTYQRRVTGACNESQATSVNATSSVNWTGTLAEGDYQYESKNIITLSHGWKTFGLSSMAQTRVNDPAANKGVIVIASNGNSRISCR